MSRIWSCIASLTNIAAEFRVSIGASIPQIVDLLQGNWKDREAGATALAMLSEQGM